MNGSPNYNTILLPTMNFPMGIKSLPMRTFVSQDENELVLIPDWSWLQFLIEEFISAGAVAIAMLPDWRTQPIYEQLHPVLKKRVKFIDQSEVSLNKVKNLFEPICDEFHIEKIGIHGASLDRATGDDSVGFLKEVYLLFSDIYMLMLGFDHRLQISINHNETIARMRALYERSHNDLTRAHLSILMGILSGYRQHSVACLERREAGILVEMFEEFIEDGTYRAASEQAYKLGFPAEMARAKRVMFRHLKRVATKPPFRQCVDFSTKVLSAATSMPLPDTALAEAMLRNKYMPPILNFDIHILESIQSWRRVRPEFRAIDSHQALRLKEGNYTEVTWSREADTLTWPSARRPSRRIR